MRNEKCLICSKLLKGLQKKYCSNKCKCNTSNAVYQNYTSQQKRGLERKYTALKLKGGECVVCGYSKNSASLEFHHINGDKELKLTMRCFSNNKWSKILKELEKCEIRCANCHREHHNPDMSNWNSIDS